MVSMGERVGSMGGVDGCYLSSVEDVNDNEFELIENENSVLYTKETCPDEYIAINEFLKESSLSITTQGNKINFVYTTIIPPDIFKIQPAINGCDYDWVNDGNTFSSNDKTNIDLDKCFEKSITSEHIVYTNTGTLSLLYDDTVIGMVNSKIVISYEKMTTAIVEFSVQKIIINDELEDTLLPSIPSIAYLCDDINCKEQRDNTVYNVGDKVYMIHKSTNKAVDHDQASHSGLQAIQLHQPDRPSD